MQRLTNRSANLGSCTFLVCLTITVFVALYALGHFNLTTEVIAVGAAGIVEMGRRMKIAELRKRASQKRDVTWTVFVNGIPVGEMVDELVARISLDALLDARNYVRQTAQVLKVFFYFSRAVFIAIPCILVWFVVAAGLFAPTEFTAAIHGLSATDISQMSSSIGMLLMEMSTLVAAAWIVFGGRTGFVDAFAQDRSRRLRVVTKTSAVGDVTIVPQ